MSHAALTPLLGREFDAFLFASIGEDDGPPLSVVSALARLDVDPWKEAESLARMSREDARARLTSLIESFPAPHLTSLSPGVVAARLIALLPQVGKVHAAAAAPLRPVLPVFRSRTFVGIGIVTLMLAAYFVFMARASTAPGEPDAPRAASVRDTSR